MGYIQLLGAGGVSGSFVFQSAAAEVYWNALTSANSGVEIQGSVYGITNTQLKQAIDDFFVAGTTGSWLSAMKILRLHIGATSATHAINACNPGTFVTTYPVSPTFTAAGTVYNGTTQYGNWNNNPSTDGITTTSGGVTHFTSGFAPVGGTAYQLIGGQNATGQRISSTIATTGFWNWGYLSTGTGTAVSSNTTVNKVVSNNRTAANDSQIYVDGTSVVTLTTNAGSLPTVPLFEGAFNSNGTPSTYTPATFKFSALHTGLNSTQVTSLTNATKALNTALNR